MREPLSIQAGRLHGRFGPGALAALSCVVFLGYTATLAVANQLAPLDAILGGAANTIPVVLFGLLAWRVITERILGRSLVAQLAGHLAVATLFAVLTYWLTTVLLGLVNGKSPTQFTVEPFIRRAMAWQVFENYTTYGVIAALAYIRPLRPSTLAAPAPAGDEIQPGKGAARYFVRSGEDLRPLEIDRIVSITGADDYAEVATLDGRHLVRVTLAEFERSLDPGRFVRVHRSRIINLDHLDRAEPAGGGRMLLHMEDGEIIAASRAGTRLLRDLVI